MGHVTLSEYQNMLRNANSVPVRKSGFLYRRKGFLYKTDKKAEFLTFLDSNQSKNRVSKGRKIDSLTCKNTLTVFAIPYLTLSALVRVTISTISNVT